MELPSGTVGWVHSHPYSEGEDIGAACGVEEKTPYQGIQSIGDTQLQRELALNAMSNGYINDLSEFTGMVIDKDGIRLTDGSLGFGETITENLIKNNTQTEQPCGYQ